jgi:heterodisulfide reductase subunit A
MSKQIAVIGAGTAGLEAASALASMGFSVTLVEKSDSPGGHVQQWHQLFPNGRAGLEIVDALMKKVSASVQFHYNKEVSSIQPFSGKFIISASDGWVINADAVLITTGFDLFDARKKEEYGYGIYDHVITSDELENLFRTPDGVRELLGKSPDRVGFVHCVGSRDEKAGNLYCSKVCCVTAVKQAIEIKELFPLAEVYCFYMDLRMFGRHYEELYKEAQEKYNIQFIRGRLSEASENKQKGVVLKVEDTLLGKPLKITVDILVLMSGMVPSSQTGRLRDSLGLYKDDDGFLKPVDLHLMSNVSEIPGIFVAGACTGPKTLTDTLTDARSAALAVMEYFNKIG